MFHRQILPKTNPKTTRFQFIKKSVLNGLCPKALRLISLVRKILIRTSNSLRLSSDRISNLCQTNNPYNFGNRNFHPRLLKTKYPLLKIIKILLKVCNFLSKMVKMTKIKIPKMNSKCPKDPKDTQLFRLWISTK